MNDTKNDRLVLKVPEAGKLLGLGRCAAYKAAASGELPTLRIGRLLRVPKQAIDRMLEQASALREVKQK